MTSPRTPGTPRTAGTRSDRAAVADAVAAFIECTLDLAAQIPPGRVSTYGRIALEARLRCGRGSARGVGRVMATRGSEVPWWRVVTASGAPAELVAGRAVALLRAEGTPFAGERVDLAAALHAFETDVVVEGAVDA
ncbi:MGMT family protein [Litorihabitans aurantiacus]|uniref:Methylated-DNA-[protein]-cysteine S-methyltransferase DNA binding domain-containing protein n=1 Tax=Litorihabitans aurantiacus TaxID=1930061 RepID=A0AA37XEN3_9MICO|nr:MGMT family protein [Litorihabitans aurantiacus]GMA31896.1 hypothetical protein GCM10025875_18880 [Litorihabitans aurantiacus]